MSSTIGVPDMLDEQSSRRRITCPYILYLFTFLSCLGMCFMFAVRVNMSIAIVAMVNHTAVDNATQTKECAHLIRKPENISDPVKVHTKAGTFNWSPSMQALILGSFYYIFSVMQIPGGRLAEMLGGKWVFIIGLGSSLLLTLLVPYAAVNSFHMLVLIRMLTGAAQGVCFPAIYNLMGRWLPMPEKSLLQNVILSGIDIGTFVAMPVTGVLCNSTIMGGWPSAFYLIGLVGLAFCLIWIFLITDSPTSHPFISDTELDYITRNQNLDQTKELPPIPWKRVLTSLPMWSLVIAQIGNDWCYYTLLSHLPQFFNDILHFDLEANGLLSSFPYLLEAVVAVLSGYISDFILRKKIVSVIFARRLFNTIAGVGAAVGLGGVMVSGCNVTAHIIFFAIVMSLSGLSYSGYPLNILDLSPEYAGTVMGIMNTASTLGGFITSAVVGLLTDKQNTMHQWGFVFMISIAMLLTSCFFYLFFSSAEKEMWHMPKESKSRNHSRPSPTLRPGGMFLPPWND